MILQSKYCSLYNSQKIYDLYSTLLRQDRKTDPSLPYLLLPYLPVPSQLSQITNKLVVKKAHAHTPTSLAIKGIMESS